MRPSKRANTRGLVNPPESLMNGIHKQPTSMVKTRNTISRTLFPPKGMDITRQLGILIFFLGMYLENITNSRKDEEGIIHAFLAIHGSPSKGVGGTLSQDFVS